MNHEPVYWTAPATPGLLNTWKKEIGLWMNAQLSCSIYCIFWLASSLLIYMVIFSQARKLEMVKKTQYIKSEVPYFFPF